MQKTPTLTLRKTVKVADKYNGKYYIPYDMEGKDEKKKETLQKDQDMIPAVLAELDQYGRLLFIGTKPPHWYPSVFFYLKYKHMVLQFELCDRRFAIRGIKGKTVKEFNTAYLAGKAFQFHTHQDWVTLDTLYDKFFRNLEAICY